MADEYRDSLCLFGLKLSDIHELLEVTLGNSYFIYNQILYKQLLGLFMGSRPAPVIAVIRMYIVEKNSIYTDLIITLIYGRYIDDLGSTAKSKDLAQQLLDSIEQNDADNHIKLELDYPKSKEDFTPFLNMEIRINDSGEVESRLYRKPTKKQITLHKESHHPTSTKIEVINNMYTTATKLSSNETNKEHSYKITNNLLLNNGYTQNYITKALDTKKKKKGKPMKTNANKNTVPLVIPYINDHTSARIRSSIKKSGLPIRLIATPGKKLRSHLTNSRPLDKPTCSRKKCRTCTSLKKNGERTVANCTDKNVTYKLTCNNCTSDKATYVGETYRPIHERYDEHFRTANNPTAKSYSKKTIAKHFVNKHPGETPDIEIEVLNKCSSTINRKIIEARDIIKHQPNLNEKDETRQFLIND